MPSTNLEINEYLACEFVAEDERPASDDWPFQLFEIGRLLNGTRVLSFHDADGEYWVLDGASLTYLPRDGFTLADLELQEQGSHGLPRGTRSHSALPF